MTDKTKTGLYNKFVVTRTDGTSEPGKKHEGCEYFVLDTTHDKHAYAALLAYAESCEPEYPALARDLSIVAHLMKVGSSTYFQKPETAIVDDALAQRVDALLRSEGMQEPQQDTIHTGDDDLLDHINWRKLYREEQKRADQHELRKQEWATRAEQAEAALAAVTKAQIP